MTTLRELQQQRGNTPIIGKDIYTYTFIFSRAQLIPNAVLTDTINIQNDSQFLWTKATFFARINDTDAIQYQSRVIPQVTFQWRDTSSSQQLFNFPVFINNFWGFGEIPMILPEPKLMEPRTSVTVDVTNLHATESYDLYLSMIGIKIYR